MTKRKTTPADEVLDRVDSGRREALRKMLAGAAFIAPALMTLPLVHGSAAPADPQFGPVPTIRPRPTPTRRPHS
jgi:hypothetical protein